MSEHRRVHIGVQYNGEAPHEIWHRDVLPSINTTSSFVSAVDQAQRALFDFSFQAETSALPETDGRLRESEVVGRVDNVTAQSYLATRFRDIGFVSTINTSYNDAYDIARRLHALDVISKGRAGWNLVLGGNPLAAANARDIGDRRGIDRYADAARTLTLVQALLGGEPALRPAAPQGAPFVFYAGDSDRSRDFAAAHADAIYTHYADVEHGTRFSEDVRRRCARVGRVAPLTVFARLAVIAAATDADARAVQHELLPRQLHVNTVRAVLEQIWKRPFDDHDADAPLPSDDPPAGTVRFGGSFGVHLNGDTQWAAARLRAAGKAHAGSSRAAIVLASGTDVVVGGGSSVAETLIDRVDRRAVDGFVIVPHVTGSWVEAFARWVVPELQIRGAYPSGYRDETLRERVASEVV